MGQLNIRKIRGTEKWQLRDGTMVRQVLETKPAADAALAIAKQAKARRQATSARVLAERRTFAEEHGATNLIAELKQLQERMRQTVGMYDSDIDIIAQAIEMLINRDS